MYEWFFLLLTPRMAADAPLPSQEYYVGLVAAEAAYTTLQVGVPDEPKPTPAPPVDPKNCQTCKNSGRPGWVRTGDGQGWTKCPTCQPVEQAAPSAAAPAPATPTAGWPPKPREDCDNGSCPISPAPVTSGTVRFHRSR